MMKSARIGLYICISLVLTGVSSLAAEALRLHPENLQFANIDKLKLAQPSLNGQDTTIAVVSRSITYINGQPQNDYRPDINHNCFKSARFDFYNDNFSSPGVSDHSTAVCSILFGSDDEAFADGFGKFRYEGIAPAAQGNIYEFWYFLKENVFTNNAPQADVISASVGSVFDDWWTRGLESLAEHNGTIIAAGIGNGKSGYSRPLFPAAGANIIGVGVAYTIFSSAQAFDNQAKVSPTDSSCGPTDDGRCKPDLVAPADMLTAVAADPNSYELSGDYTSFATPVVAGTIALLTQYAKSDENIKKAWESSQKNCLIKAILMNSARKLPYWHKGSITKDDDHFAPLDRIQGAGLLDALAAYKTLASAMHKAGDVPNIGWDSDELKTYRITENTYKLDINEPNDKIITATICWNRHFEKAYPFNHIKEKDTDIRLELWAYDSSGQLPDKLLDFSDSKTDNVEHIYCPADANYTEYEISAVLTNTENSREQLSQRYSIAWNVSKRDNQPTSQWYDLNSDNKINELDFGILMHNIYNFNQKSDEYLIGDINDDGSLDMKDVNVFLRYFASNLKKN